MPSPGEQITALVSGFADSPPDGTLPCKKKKTHTIELTVRWKDDKKPVDLTDVKIYEGKNEHADDSVVKGKYKEKDLPPGTYKLIFPEIDASEIEQE